jgi:hypothetical protein
MAHAAQGHSGPLDMIRSGSGFDMIQTHSAFGAVRNPLLVSAGAGSEQLAEVREQLVFPCPWGVHETADQGYVAGELEPSLHVAHVIRIIVTGHEDRKAVLSKEA